jgi:hypothetical protein
MLLAKKKLENQTRLQLKEKPQKSLCPLWLKKLSVQFARRARRLIRSLLRVVFFTGFGKDFFERADARKHTRSFDRHKNNFRVLRSGHIAH